MIGGGGGFGMLGIGIVGVDVAGIVGVDMAGMFTVLVACLVIVSVRVLVNPRPMFYVFYRVVGVSGVGCLSDDCFSDVCLHVFGMDNISCFPICPRAAMLPVWVFVW